jgi:hypothetical protein
LPLEALNASLIRGDIFKTPAQLSMRRGFVALRKYSAQRLELLSRWMLLEVVRGKLSPVLPKRQIQTQQSRVRLVQF